MRSWSREQLDREDRNDQKESGYWDGKIPETRLFPC